MAKNTGLTITLELTAEQLTMLAEFACRNATQLTEAELASCGIDFDATVAKVSRDAAFRRAVATAAQAMSDEDLADALLNVLDDGANIPALDAYWTAQDTWLENSAESKQIAKIDEAIATLKQAGYTVSKKKA